MQFFSELQHLILHEPPISDNAIALLMTLAKISTKLCIIKSQEQLRLFSIYESEYASEFDGIISALESQENSLQKVVLTNCGYNKEFEALKNSKNLETLCISYCDYLKMLIMLKILDYNKISTLEVVGYVEYLLKRLRFEPLQRGEIQKDHYYWEHLSSSVQTLHTSTLRTYWQFTKLSISHVTMQC
ncbi:hypothetical protein F8M41_009180 [Gigaspora margarita]|uniref:Uncharacterized protein n=1 Tax=Gigaspora margarita TaxID=4874 RepID=A0A8H3X2L0_GIGMA|nr:hypothetical protein F8M41_009180 [Gigaspora margarita]